MAKKLSATEQIGMYLAQADATPHEEEKKTFMEAAQRIAARMSIDIATARAAVAKLEEREKPTFRRMTLGEPGQRALSWYVELMLGIARANDCRCTMAMNSTAITLYGMPSDIEVCEAIYATAITSMIQGGDDYLKRGDYKKDVAPRRVKTREPNPDYDPHWHWGSAADNPKYIYTWSTVHKPVSGMTARQNFYQGYAREIERRLMAAKREVEAAQVKVEREAAEDSTAETSTEIVLRSKGREVGEFYSQSTGKLGTWRGSKSPVYSGTARSAGRSHAQSTQLHGRKSLPGSRTQIGS